MTDQLPLPNEPESLRIVAGCKTYSQAHQDLFVRMMLGFKEKGYYCEIGAAEPKQSNNTFILESEFGWSGLSLDINPDLVREFRRVRRNQCIHADATNFEYKKYFCEHSFPEQIDYLSLDIDPAEVTYKALTALPHDKYRFSVITYEHDRYMAGEKYMLKQRAFLDELGYFRVVSNVLCCNRDFEDWWIDPKIVSRGIYEPFIRENIECANVFTDRSI